MALPCWASLERTPAHPTTHHQHPFPSSPQVGITSHPLFPRDCVEVRRPTGSWDVHPLPHPASKVTSLLASRGHSNRGSTKHKEVLLSQGSGCRVRQERQGSHTPAQSLPLSLLSSSSSKSLSLVCLSVLCLKSSQSKKGGRVQGVGRLVAAAGAMSAGER